MKDDSKQHSADKLFAGRFLESILDTSREGMMIIGPDKRIRYLNRAALEMMGRPAIQDVIDKSCCDFFRMISSEACPLGGRSGSTSRHECILIHSSGKEIPIEKNAVLLDSEEGQILIETFRNITVTKKHTAELAESRRQFNTLIDNLPGMVFRCQNDPSWTMEFVSRGSFELTGYRPEDLVRNKRISYGSLILEEDQKRIRAEVQTGISINLPYTIEYRIRCADGRIKWVWEKGKRLVRKKEKIVLIEGFITDITAMKTAGLIQDVLQEISRASYSSNTLEELIGLIHTNLGRIIEVDNFFVALYDETTNSISLPFQVDSKDHFSVFPAGKTLTGYVIETQKPLLATQQVIDELARTGKIDIVGTLARVWMGVPLIVDGKVTGVIAVQSYTNPDLYSPRDLELLRFVAEQVATAIARKNAEASLLKEKAYLDCLFESSPAAIVMNDMKGRIVKANPSFLSLFGFSPEEIAGKFLDDLIADPGTRPESDRLNGFYLAGKTDEKETRRRHRDGHWIDVSVTGNPIIIDDKIMGEYCIYRDITDRKRIEKSMIEARERAEVSDRMKSAFLSNMSHEIRTPMNAILGFSSLLTDPGLNEDERSEFVQIIIDRGNDLMRLIDDIIDIARIESGQVKIDIRECKVNLLLENLMVTLKEVKRKTNKSMVELECVPGTADPDFAILTDGNRLRQILTNLIENGLKFTEHGSVTFGYRLREHGDEPAIEFFVSDTGIGIPQEVQDIVFERFRQADDSVKRKYGGTGLGLTISKNLAHLLGGRIIMESEKGRGTTFYLILPLKSAVRSQETPAAPGKSSVKQAKWKKKAILIVEDEDSNFLLVERLLAHTGAELIWVRDGIEAIEMCNSRKIDVVLMDIRIPLLDGYETTQIIKKDHRDIPVIAHTAYALKGEREKSFAAGCDDYIPKPIDPGELFSVLGRFLNPKK